MIIRCKSFVLFCLVLVPVCLFGQGSDRVIQVGGVVVLNSDYPVGDAMVTVVSSNGRYSSHSMTDASGKFIITMALPMDDITIDNSFDITIQRVGIKEFNKTISVGTRNIINLGLIKVTALELEASFSTAESHIISTPDGYKYDVLSDSLAQSKKINHLITKLPFMELGMDNIPRYFGVTSNILYLVNGKQSQELNNNNVMRQLSGLNIKSIEMILNPPAGYIRYDAVIDVKTNKFSLFDGMLLTPSTSVHASYSDMSVSPSVNIVSNKHRLTFDVSGNYSHSFPIAPLSDSVSIMNDNGSILSRSVKNSSSVTDDYSGNLAIKYKIDKTNSLSTYFNIANYYVWSDAGHLFFENGRETSSSIYSENKNRSIAAGANYTNGEFGGKSFEATYDFSHELSSNMQRTSFGNSYTILTRQDIGGKSMRHSLNLNQMIPLKNRQSIAFGANADLNKKYNTILDFVYNSTTEVWEDLPDNCSNNENILITGNIFTTYTFRIKRSSLSFQGYLSYYHNGYKDNDRTVSYTRFNFLPQIKYTCIFGKGNILNINYVRSVMAPVPSMLNPAKISIDPSTSFVGNPELDQEIKNRLTASINTRIKKHMFNISAIAEYNSNIIERISTVSENDIITMTYQNLSDLWKLSLRTSYNYKPVNKIDINLVLNGSYLIFPQRTLLTYNSSAMITYRACDYIRIRCGISYSPLFVRSQSSKLHNMLMSSVTLAGNSKNQKLNYELVITPALLINKNRETLTVDDKIISSVSQMSGLSAIFKLSYTIGDITK